LVVCQGRLEVVAVEPFPRRVVLQPDGCALGDEASLWAWLCLGATDDPEAVSVIATLEASH